MYFEPINPSEPRFLEYLASTGVPIRLHKAHLKVIMDLYRGLAASVNELMDLLTKVLEDVKALGALPEGYCFCAKDRDANKPEEKHTGECRNLRQLIKVADEDWFRDVKVN